MSSDPIEVQMQLTMTRFEEWIRNDILHLRWWTVLLVFVVDIYLWWKIVDKSRLREIILYASITALMILVLDEIGEELTLWYYPTDVFPLFPPVEAIDIACLPFLYAIIYQLCSKWKGYIIAMAGMSVFSCFIFEPIFIWLGMYQTLTWKTYYGLPLYFAIGIISKAVLSMLKAIQKKHVDRQAAKAAGI